MVTCQKMLTPWSRWLQRWAARRRRHKRVVPAGRHGDVRDLDV